MGLIQSSINNMIHTTAAALTLGKDKEEPQKTKQEISAEEIAKQQQAKEIAKDRDAKRYAEAMAKAQAEQLAKDAQKKQVETIRNSFLNWQDYKG